MRVWPTFKPRPETIQAAWDLHNYRVRKFGYSNYVTDYGDKDDRWVGELGEGALNVYLKRCGVTDYHWEREDVLTKPDFTILRSTVDVKTTTRKAPPKPHYTVELGKHHTVGNKARDYYCFLSFQKEVPRLWLVGFISHHEAITQGVYYPCGAEVNNSDRPGTKKFVVRDKQGVYILKISQLVHPDAWLNMR